MRRRRWPHPGWLGLSMAAMLLVLALGAYWSADAVRDWRMVRQLASDHSADRERALAYVMREAGERHRVLAGALSQARQADDQRFVEIVNALDAAGHWRRETVGAELWLRWVGVLAGEDHAGARVTATQRLADLYEHADEQAVRRLLASLLDDEDATVRYNALAAAGELSGHAADREAYERMIAERATDDEPTVARHAWLMLGLLGPSAVQRVEGQVDWRSADADVAEAMLWATLAANPHEPGPALVVLDDAQAPLRLRAMAAYALHPSDTYAALSPMLGWLNRDATRMSPADRVVLWRVVLAVRGEQGLAALQEWLARHDTAEARADERLRPIVLAATWRHASLGGAIHVAAADDALQRLALIEGAYHGRGLTWRDEYAQLPMMTRLAALAAAESVDADAFRPLLTHEQATIRDLACVVAVDRLDGETLGALIEDMLRSLNHRANMSGAMMAGLSGKHEALLREATAAKDDWAVQMMMRLGMWMQGQLPELDGRVVAMLARPELPRSTVLLGLLSREPATALDQLLTPRGEIGPELVELLEYYRFQRVLDRFLPDDAPRLWLWADDQLKAFQLQLLREWYLLNRHRF